MKVPSVLPGLLAFLALPGLWAQEPAAPAVRTYIPHSLEVKPFTPPPPPVVKRLPVVRIDASVTRGNSDGTTLTLQRGEPSAEPDLPPPPPPRPYVAPRELTAEEKARLLYRRRHSLNFGATIYDHRVSVVRWTDPGNGAHYQAVCGFDIGLLAGVGHFIHGGERYSLMMVHSDFDTTRWLRPGGRSRPVAPEAAPGEIRITCGDAGDEAAVAPITIVRDIITAEMERLIPYQAARDVYFKASAAWHAAHPPVPRDETIILRPHRGSRYLPSTKSEARNPK